MERFCELIAAMKLRTTNLKGRHLSTGRALELLVEHGIETPDGLVRAPPGLLTRTTVNRYLRAWGMDQRHLNQPPPATRFEALRSNECWQFDLSPSDLKQVPAPLWVEPGRGPPTLMLFSIVDGRSGVAYQEDRLYGVFPVKRVVRLSLRSLNRGEPASERDHSRRKLVFGRSCSNRP